MLLSEYIETNRRRLEQSFYYTISKKPNDVPDEFEDFCMDFYVVYSLQLLQNFKLAEPKLACVKASLWRKIKDSFCCDL